VLTYSNRRDF